MCLRDPKSDTPAATLMHVKLCVIFAINISKFNCSNDDFRQGLSHRFHMYLTVLAPDVMEDVGGSVK